MDLQELDRSVAFYQGQALAKNTKRSYASQLKSYTNFCELVGVPPFPASTLLLCRYAAHLAKRLKYSSIKQYFAVIVLLHRQLGLQNPCSANFPLSNTLRGIRRCLGDRPCRKEPMTPALLSALLNHLNVHEPRQAMVWATALLLFFGLLRRSNVLCFPRDFDPRAHLRRCDLELGIRGLLVTIHWSKTDQFRTKHRRIPYPRMRGHPLCPTSAVFNALQLTPRAEPEGPAFPGLTPRGFFQTVSRALQRAGLETAGLGSHSFRRGGATFLWSVAGVPESKIRALGDWSSAAYLLYTISTQEALGATTSAMAEALTDLN